MLHSERHPWTPRTVQTASPCGLNAVDSIAFAAGKSHSSAHHAVHRGLGILFYSLLYCVFSRVRPDEEDHRENNNLCWRASPRHVSPRSATSRHPGGPCVSTKWGGKPGPVHSPHPPSGCAAGRENPKVDSPSVIFHAVCYSI